MATASKQDVERELAALRESAIKDCDKLRAAAFKERDRLLADGEKQAAQLRQAAEDERIKKLMASSPRRLELLQDIKGLEKQKGQLKNEREAFEKECAALRAAIVRDKDKAHADTLAEKGRILAEAERHAAQVRARVEKALQEVADMEVEKERLARAMSNLESECENFVFKWTARLGDRRKLI